MSLAYGAVVAGVAVLAIQGTSDLASVGAVLLLMLRSLSYGQQLQSTSGSIAASLPHITRLQDTVAEYEHTEASGGAAEPASVTPIELDNVSYEYVTGQNALIDVSMRIDTHEVIGVVGPSGAGKSTLVQLLLGLRDPSLGNLRIGGVELCEVDRTWWARRVALVPQDAQLFTGTVADNIRFFRDELTDDDLERAATQANLLVDIRSLANGFDTHLGERGSRLSGGQRQRLSIARALAGQPELLILDEPTSALDMESEVLVRSAIAALRGQTTAVIIAHRMSTLEICDRILVIEHGQATAFDTPQNLFNTNVFYRNALEISGLHRGG